MGLSNLLISSVIFMLWIVMMTRSAPRCAHAGRAAAQAADDLCADTCTRRRAPVDDVPTGTHGPSPAAPPVALPPGTRCPADAPEQPRSPHSLPQRRGDRAQERHEIAAIGAGEPQARSRCGRCRHRQRRPRSRSRWTRGPRPARAAAPRCARPPGRSSCRRAARSSGRGRRARRRCAAARRRSPRA